MLKLMTEWPNSWMNLWFNLECLGKPISPNYAAFLKVLRPTNCYFNQPEAHNLLFLCRSLQAPTPAMLRSLYLCKPGTNQLLLLPSFDSPAHTSAILRSTGYYSSHLRPISFYSCHSKVHTTYSCDPGVYKLLLPSCDLQTPPAILRDAQLKSMELTINNAEKYMGQFCTLLAAYTRKTAKLRDKADSLVQQLHEFSSTEGPEVRICLKNFSEDLAMVQDYRQAEVERLETRVVSPLKAYGNIVKTKRADLKRFSADRNREIKELQRLEKLRLRNPADIQSITQAETSVQKANSNANRSSRQMEETITDFQRQKLSDVKRIFTEFIMVEMLFHSKALEVYTHTFNNLETMDIDKDLEVFRNQIQISGTLLEDTALITGLPQYPSLTQSTFRLTHQPSLSNPMWTSDQPKKSLNRTFRRQEEMEEEEEEEEEEGEEEERYDTEEDVEEPKTFRQSYAAQYTTSLRQK
ncbi:CBY1-interacting BAR domain-containing protein 2-like [Neoarius graeffei]|uniref:CBY1-interacting BAR domain-containing protein 2-like n=1 Tax=Neoarius graeffei TaxID=443677 RepID=UPI00298CCB3C|nr:CBY1-interacting BAR domain-containing protein 2-like [Neoarius graeffei]